MKLRISILLLIFTVGLVIFLAINGFKELSFPKRNYIPSTKVSPTLNAIQPGLEEATVKKVIDGDTIELTTGQKVRYIGIDTPETVHPTKGVQCFGKEASEMNKQLVEGKKVLLEKDVSETDKYGRLLRYVYLKTDTGAIFINKYLVDDGYAKTTTFPPDVKYIELFRASERQAQQSQKGLWSSCQ